MKPILYKPLSTLLLLSFSVVGYAQPSNDACSDAIAIVVETDCTPQTFSTNGATTEGPEVAPVPSCGFFSGNDVWFTFTSPASGQFRIEVDAIGNNAIWTLYTGSCGNLTEVFCAGNANTIRQNFNDPGLGNTDYHLRVFRFGGTSPIDFNLCIFETEPPTNDNCEDALPIAVTNDCEPQSFSTQFSTSQPPATASAPSCGFFSGNDVWFTFTSPASGQFRIEVDALGNNAIWTLYTGSCGNLTEVFCAGNTNTIRQNFNDPALGNTDYHLRVFRFGGTSSIDFNLCIFETEPPVNDNCEDALPIAVTNDCEPQSFSTQFSTSQPPATAPTPSCGFFSGNDVWFTFTSPASGQFRIEVDALGNNAIWTLYTGSCGNLIEVFCAGNTNTIRQNFNDPALGNTDYHLRVFRFGGTSPIDFNLCIFETEPPVNDNCANASFIDINEVCQGELSTTEYATGEGTAIAPNPSCGFYQGNDVWFTFTVPASGEFRVDVSSVSNNAIWALYSGTCGEFTQLACAGNVSQLIQTFSLPELAEDLLYLRVFRFAANDAVDFTVCILEVETPVNDNCSNAIELIGSALCSPIGFSSVFSTSESEDVAVQPSCGAYSGGDVWFKFTAPSSGQFTLITEHFTGGHTQYALYSGSCGAFTELDCSSTGTVSYNDPALGGEVLYLRLWAFGSSQGGSFSICVEASEPPVNDLCENAIPLGYNGISCDPEVFTNAFASNDEAQPAPMCVGYSGGDVWFTLQMPESGPVQLNLEGLESGLYFGAIYQGDCTALTQIDCIEATGAVNLVNNALASEQLLIRVWRVGSTEGGSFSLCAGPANCLADLNFDGIVNASDLGLFLTEFGCVQSCNADFNGDGVVNSSDLSIFLSAFGDLCIN